MHAALAAAALAGAVPCGSVAGTTGGIAGYAETRDGAHVPNLHIQIFNPVTGLINTMTDARGFYVILALPPGRYEFMSSHVGVDYFFSAQCLAVDVEADDVLRVNLWLDRDWETRESSCEIEGLQRWPLLAPLERPLG